MRKIFSKKAVLLPLPVYIIGTYDENRKANAMNLAWEYNVVIMKFR